MRLRIAVALLLAAQVVACQAGQVNVTRLRCEYAVNPVGIDTAKPRLSWIVESCDRGQRQTAYQVLVASSPAALANDRGDLWDSGRVTSDRSILIPYSGKVLASRARCWWKVRAWDTNDVPSRWSTPARWSLGLVRQQDWRAKWIGDPAYEPSRPMPIFRRGFTLAKPVSHAEVSACGLGSFELRVNGVKPTDSVLEPGWTNYRRNCPHVTYDVTRLLRKGGNALGALLGNGMYNVVGGRYAKFTGSFGPPKLILRLDVTFADGSSQAIVSDGHWRVAHGPVTFSCIYGGEDFDATAEPAGWDLPGFDDSSWRAAQVVDGPGGMLVARSMPPIEVDRHYRPSACKQLAPNVRVYDLGQNMSGWPVVKVTGPAGAKVKITLSESWDRRGPLGGWPVWFTYTLKGGGEQTWRPRFTYYGFRYAQVEVLPSPDGKLPTVRDLRAEFVHCDADRCGSFECSNETVNRIHKLINMAILSNYQSVLTDCPHREKLGWIEQAHLVFGGVTSNYDSAAFYSKIVRDMSEAQTADGLIPDIAPEYTVFQGGFRDSPEWGSAYVICPWQVYQTYGDPSLLAQHYEGMKRYVLYLKSKSTDGIVSHGLGDWYDVGPGSPGGSQLTSTGLTATAIYYRDITIMRQAAEVLGKSEDARMWSQLADQVREAFTRKFFHPETRSYDTGSQTANAMPLVVGLVDRRDASGVLEALVKDVRGRENRVTAGDVGFAFLVRALTDAGRDDVLWDMVTQYKGPGYVWQLNRGATTLTEAWDANPGSSLNHLMLGHAEEWFYRGLAGIRQESPGFRRFSIRPALVGDLKWVKAHYDCPYGRIESEWKRENGRFTLKIAVPVGATATIYIPAPSPNSVTESGTPAGRSPGVRFIGMSRGRAVYGVGSGKYEFAVPWSVPR